MSLAYQVMYRVGFTPWDNDSVPGELSTLVEGSGALPAERALDIGCGTGSQAVYLASHGWRVTAVDEVEKALRRARARSAAAGVEVDWIKADVARLPKLGLPPGYGLIFDRGCYHGLPEAARAGYAQGAHELSGPDATLLLMSFEPNRKPFGPAGAAKDELEARFGDSWTLVQATPATERSPKGPMAGVPLTWYRFTRR